MAKKVLIGCLAGVGAICVVFVILLTKLSDEDNKYNYAPFEDEYYW